MSYTVKLAVFPPWKAPVPYETLSEVFASNSEAAEAGAKALGPIIERELSELNSALNPRSLRVDGGSVKAIDVPCTPVHGYMIYDEAGVEVGNWTTLDVAVERVAED